MTVVQPVVLCQHRAIMWAKMCREVVPPAGSCGAEHNQQQRDTTPAETRLHVSNETHLPVAVCAGTTLQQQQQQQRRGSSSGSSGSGLRRHVAELEAKVTHYHSMRVW